MSDELVSRKPSETAPAHKRAAELTNSLHHIIVVGGGAAGLELVTRIRDRSRAHLWKPLLHEVAAGSMDVGHHALDYLAQAHWHHFRYRYGEMIGLDRTRREVHLAATYDDEGNQITEPRSFGYDTLVICVGSISNNFNTPGVKQHAIALDTPEQAVRFHKRLVNACIRAHAQTAPVRPGQLHVTIIGAGATGTELAAELHRTTREVVAYGLDRIDPAKDLHITLIEAADRILPALPLRISEATARLLADLGVDVRPKAKVSRVRSDGVELAGGDFIPSELVVWAAGVKGPDVLGALDGLEVSRANQLVVTPTLQTTRDPRIFAIGDCAYLLPRGRDQTDSAARSGRAPAGVPFGQAARSAVGRRGATALRVSRLRLARVARRIQHDRQPDGLPGRQEHADRRLLCQIDVSFAVSDASRGPAWPHQGRSRHDRAGAHAPHGAACEAALTGAGPSHGWLGNDRRDGSVGLRHPQQSATQQGDGVHRGRTRRLRATWTAAA